MRKILFRGKWNNGAWVYGDLRQYSETHIGIYSYDLKQTVKGIDPDTVGQYTGLTDYNGQPIYEDDIVEIQIGDLQKCGVVIYSDRAARWGIMETDGNLNFSFLQQPLVKQYSIKVVGNKHDWEYVQE